LPGANLNGAVLLETILTGANLGGAHLIAADLTKADLRGANLFGADLTKADLRGANLTKANLFIAHLTEAKLRTADLTEANLQSADLTKADLRGANFTAAKLDYIDLTKAVYAPASEPPHPYVAGIKGISKVNIPQGEEVGLVQLRKLFRDAGLRALEREATYSIECARTSERRATAIFRRLAFHLPTAYGLHPARALFLIMVIWLVCALIYCWPIVYDPGQSQQAGGIYRIPPEKRIGGPADNPEIEKDPEVRRVQAANLWEAVPSAAYFSPLSAVNIGFQEFTPGDWIRRLQLHEYELRAEGWVRRVAGVQALLSPHEGAAHGLVIRAFRRKERLIAIVVSESFWRQR
jgi:Pentapeptide repeats (8 copies)